VRRIAAGIVPQWTTQFAATFQTKKKMRRRQLPRRSFEDRFQNSSVIPPESASIFAFL
jgi:hypothetical protein